MIRRLIIGDARTRSLTLAVAFGIVLAGCSQTASIMPSSNAAGQSGETAGKAAFSQFPDLPIPAGSKINVDKTLVFGSKPWFGQLALNASGSANAMFDFYREHLSGYGWQEITSVRAPTSILTYANDERVLAIAIRSATITGSEVTITVSPRGKPQPAGGATGVLPPPVQRATQ